MAQGGDLEAPTTPYASDSSLRGKLRRRLARWMHRRPVRRAPERPMVSFTFDDAPSTAARAGAHLLEKAGLRGAFYFAAGLLGSEGPSGGYANGEDLAALAAAGHEIACHTYTHLDCGEAAAAEIEDDVDLNGEMLAALGAAEPLRSFAFPYGDVSGLAKRVLSGRFASLRGLHHGLITRGADLNQLPAVGIEGPAGEAIAMRWLERAKAKRSWLILYTHDVAEKPSAWGCTPAALQRLIDRTRDLGFDVVTVAEGAARLAA